ncbi:DinB family protein [Mycolicibacterium sphagni]|uniref:DinB family protein n=1 Tax=Mycolicibacterium sphagni TaxID=1786 RepID=A0ABX2K4W1_9MYCO|nr:DinB family protein [Mycolicibacterium sphagni]NTY62750.1 DinB family protein [Mycolicibacterium sphagni]
MPSDDASLLLSFLDAQRRRVLDVIAGLDDDQLRTAVLPSGWSPLGLIEHLGRAERHWFQEVALGTADSLPWPEGGEPEPPFVSDRSAETVLAFYRHTVDAANRMLRDTPLSSPPAGRHGYNDELVTDVRFIVLHMIEETARHLGHLDAARELIDGQVGLGQDDV